MSSNGSSRSSTHSSVGELDDEPSRKGSGPSLAHVSPSAKAEEVNNTDNEDLEIDDDNAINTSTFEDHPLDPDQVCAVQQSWELLSGGSSSAQATGEAIQAALMEGAPSLAPLFTTPKAVQAMRFVNSLNSLVGGLEDKSQFRILVEMLGFQHLNLEVTVARVMIFRDAILDLLETELSDNFDTLCQEGWTLMLNYIGGALIYIRTNYSERINILLDSWKIANVDNEKTIGAGNSQDSHSFSFEQANGQNGASTKPSLFNQVKQKFHLNRQVGGAATHDNGETEGLESNGGGLAAQSNIQVRKTYKDMFEFNAAIMGFGTKGWLGEVLSSFDAIVTNVSNSARLEQECEILLLRISKCTKGPINLAQYKSCMLASLRSLLPKQWDSSYEVAWTWLWDNVERMLKKNLGKPMIWEKALRRLYDKLDENELYRIRQNMFSTFFALAPAGQDYFKQSETRLQYIAAKVMSMSLDIYNSPWQMADFISALGLRHVGYAIPTELFGPFVSATIEVLCGVTDDDVALEGFRWSLGLIAKMLVTTINEGSTIVMQAINNNSVKQLRKAVACSPRSQRAEWLLTVQVGTSSISPLAWAIESGALEAAEVIIQDLLTIRADRERYYYGVDPLFARHPDIIKLLCDEAANLLPSLLEGLVWRSRTTTKDGMRRVNYFVKNLIVDKDGGVSNTLQWLVAAKDPTFVIHPVIILVSDTLWSGIARRQFIYSKVWYVVSLMVFMLGHVFFPNVVERNQVPPLQYRIATFACRITNFVITLAPLIFEHSKDFYRAFKEGNLMWISRIPVPKYLDDHYCRSSFCLTILLTVMCPMEPFFWCIGDSSWPTEKCENSQNVLFSYSVLCMVAMAIHWLLLTDMAIFSTELSVFALVVAQVISEIGRLLVALGFLLFTFASAISVLQHGYDDMQDLPNALVALFAVTLMLYEDDYRDFMGDPVLLLVVFIFVTASSILLLNLLVAQLNCSYDVIAKNMVGYARLTRAEVISETLETCSETKWRNFVEALDFDKPLEFNEGDLGLSGGIQTLEPSSQNVVVTDTIHRYGGSCAPDMPWQGGEDLAGPVEEEDKFDRMEKLIAKTARRIKSANRERGSSASGSSGSLSKGGSIMDDISSAGGSA